MVRHFPVLHFQVVHFQSPQTHATHRSILNAASHARSAMMQPVATDVALSICMSVCMSEFSVGLFCVTAPIPTQPNANCHWLTLSLYYS